MVVKNIILKVQNKCQQNETISLVGICFKCNRMFEKIKLSNEYKKYAKTNRSQKILNIKQMNRVQNI